VTADDRLALIRVRLYRAEEHLRDLEAEISAFLDGGNPNPCEIATKRDPNTRELLYYIISVRDVPQRIAILSGDVLQNCRTTLDYSACQLFFVGSPGMDLGTQTSFPISESAATYKTEKVRKVKGMRQDAIKYIDSLEPYKGGNDHLWMLNRLNNIDKHRLLLTAACANQGRTVTKAERATFRQIMGEQQGDAIASIMPGTRDWNTPLKAGYVFYTAPPRSEVEQDLQPEIDIAFAEPQVIEREPLLETLKTIIEWVNVITLDCRPFLV
jgi:hypothetical protein